MLVVACGSGSDASPTPPAQGANVTTTSPQTIAPATAAPTTSLSPPTSDENEVSTDTNPLVTTESTPSIGFSITSEAYGYVLTVADITVREDVGSAPPEYKQLYLNGSLTVENTSTRDLARPPSVWLAYEDITGDKRGDFGFCSTLDASLFHRDDDGDYGPGDPIWCVILAAEPGDGTKLLAGETKTYELTDANRLDDGRVTVGPESVSLDGILVCVGAVPGQYECVGPDGTRARLN